MVNGESLFITMLNQGLLPTTVHHYESWTTVPVDQCWPSASLNKSLDNHPRNASLKSAWANTAELQAMSPWFDGCFSTGSNDQSFVGSNCPIDARHMGYFQQFSSAENWSICSPLRHCPTEESCRNGINKHVHGGELWLSQPLSCSKVAHFECHFLWFVQMTTSKWSLFVPDKMHKTNKHLTTWLWVASFGCSILQYQYPMALTTTGSCPISEKNTSLIYPDLIICNNGQ